MLKVFSIIFSLILLVAMFPMSRMVKAENTAGEKVAYEPFYGVTFQPVTVDTPYLYEMISIYTPEPPRENDYKNEKDINKIAQMIKEEMDARPQGTRYIIFDMLRATTKVAENVIYLDASIQMTRDWLTKFLNAYKSVDGKLDGILVDLEYSAAESYDLWKYAYRNGNPDIYADIVNDPRYATRIRPMLEQRGFQFWHDDSKPEIFGIYVDASGDISDAEENYEDYAMCGAIWNNMINDLLVEAINQSTFEPLIEYYPDAILSDYQRADFNGWLKHLDDYGNVRVGNMVKAGNTSNYNTYTNRIADGFYGSESKPLYRNVAGYNNAIFGSEPFNMTLWDTNLYKTIMSATTDTERINAWVGGYTGRWSTSVCTSANTPYYTETLFHIGMLDPRPMIGYIVQYEEIYDANNPNNEYDRCLNVLSDVLAELTRVAGAADRKTIPTPATWNGNFVLSGMYAGGRNIWRITPNTEVVSLEDFKVKDQAPTFSIDGQTIVFPQGRIIETGDVRVAGSCGYWVETPADVIPVITSETDRYSKYPAYMQDFEAFKNNARFTKTTALPNKCWEMSGDTLKIDEIDGNKVLVMTGTTTLANVKLPQNITAGDSYAKQQAWEVSVTLPEDLNLDAEIRLLSITETDGILIKNGKVYYEQSGDYQEMNGVSLTAGVTYTVKREVDFRTADAFTSSYSIYASTGELLGEAKDAPMESVSLPITSIAVSCANVDGNILLDNYKLYATGVTTDFEIYDVKDGYKLDNVNEKRTEDTAYRLSWMNATNAQKVAYVYDIKTGEVIQTVDMAPGQDGVVTGIVEVKAGGSVQLAVKTENSNAVSYPDYDNGDFTWLGFESNVEPPATEPTVPETEPTTVPETEPTTVPETEPTTADTQPNTMPSATEPNGDNVNDSGKKSGLTAGQIGLIAAVSAALIGGGVAAYFVIKNKRNAKEF